MRTSRFTEQQVVAALRQVENGTAVAEVSEFLPVGRGRVGKGVEPNPRLALPNASILTIASVCVIYLVALVALGKSRVTPAYFTIPETA